MHLLGIHIMYRKHLVTIWFCSFPLTLLTPKFKTGFQVRPRSTLALAFAGRIAVDKATPLMTWSWNHRDSEIQSQPSGRWVHK